MSTASPARAFQDPSSQSRLPGPLSHFTCSSAPSRTPSLSLAPPAPALPLSCPILISYPIGAVARPAILCNPISLYLLHGSRFHIAFALGELALGVPLCGFFTADFVVAFPPGKTFSSRWKKKRGGGLPSASLRQIVSLYARGVLRNPRCLVPLHWRPKSRRSPAQEISSPSRNRQSTARALAQPPVFSDKDKDKE